MIAYVLQRKCKMARFTDDNFMCPEIKIYSRYNFHPFGGAYDDVNVWNTTVTNKEWLDRIKDSYTIHLWSSRSKFYDLDTVDKSVINVVAAKKCPNIYFSADMFDY